MSLGTVSVGTVSLGTVSLGTVSVGTVSVVHVVGAAGNGLPPVFYAVFGVFVAAFIVLAVVTIRWAVRRDRVGRAEWVRRRQEAEKANGAGATSPPQRNSPRRNRTTGHERSAGSKT